MTSEAVVQNFLESTFTGADIMGFVSVYTVSVGYILFNIVLAYGIYRLCKKPFDKRKNLRERRFDTREK